VKRKIVPGKGLETDPTIVPTSSMFGFLERLPWKIAGRGVKYKPSAADLQEHPGRKSREEGEALLEESEGDDGAQRHQRKRSGTASSKSTTNSLSSRGDLFPSEDEDDAIPLDDEFAMVLERRNTAQGSDEAGSGKTRGKRHSASQSTRTGSSRNTKSTGDKKRVLSSDSLVAGGSEVDLPSMEDLQLEEERVRMGEEAEIEAKRQSAHRLARERGLSLEGNPPTPGEERTPPPAPPKDSDNTSQPMTAVTFAETDRDPPLQDPDRPVSPKTVSGVD